MTDSAPIAYAQMSFARDFGAGTRPDGSPVRFSRAERRLLQAFHDHPGNVLSRDQLLDVVAAVGSESRDRNIDFSIHRLRRKLGDTAGTPCFIETRYGEGYVWIAEPVRSRLASEGAFIVIGPMLGKPGGTAAQRLASTFASDLAAELRLTTAPENRVVLDEMCPPPGEFTGTPPRFSVELSFLDFNGRLDCAVVLRHFATSQIIELMRETVVDHSAGQTDDRCAARRTSQAVHTAIWEELIYRARDLAAPTHAPLPVRMQNAARLLAFKKTWPETHAHLRAKLQADPDDPQTQITLATALHSKYVMAGMILPDNDNRAADEAEIERLVLACLPKLQDNPVFLMSAGKLLHFVDGGFRPMAADIIEKAAGRGTAFAATCALLGQFRMFLGDPDAATNLFDSGMRLCQGDLEFEIYLMVLACHARLVAQDKVGLRESAERLYAKRPATRAAVSMLHTIDGRTDVDPTAFAAIEGLQLYQARGVLVWANYIGARLFASQEHAANLIRGLTTLMVDHFGPDVIPDELEATVPELVRELAGPAAARA